MKSIILFNRLTNIIDQIITRIDDMAGRIDDLEHNINDLMVQAGQSDTPALQEPKWFHIHIISMYNSTNTIM